jgi:hypothetical protein
MSEAKRCVLVQMGKLIRKNLSERLSIVLHIPLRNFALSPQNSSGFGFYNPVVDE